MSTKTVRRPKKTTKRDDAEKLPEWRRICHRYEGESQISMCGVARRKPGEEHWEDECSARGHRACVVCESLLANQPGRSRGGSLQTNSGSTSASRRMRRSSGPSAASRSRSSPSPPFATETISSA
jgi:hypothetical protein